MTPKAAYDDLVRRAKEEALLESCISLLAWDELTYLPPGGVTARADQLAYLAGLSHDQAIDTRRLVMLEMVVDSDLTRDPLTPEAVNIREWSRQASRAMKRPRRLVEELARLAPLAQQQWTLARQEGDFGLFRPWLEKIVQLKREEATCLAEARGRHALYDALLEDFEPGAHSRDLEILFAALRQELAPLWQAIRGSKKRSKAAILRRNYPLEQQRAFGQEVAAALGFDFERGRIDTAVHPFSTNIGPGDCRIAIRHSGNQFAVAFYALLHEVGHALYEQGLDPAHAGTPMGSTISLGLHESQARLWENCVGLSLPFWRHFHPRARQAFPDALGRVSLNDFYFALNHVEPHWDRVQADEVTYNLHILIRYELETALITGDLPVADLPDAWSDAYHTHLGVTPANDAEGCLQDGHWSEGLFGYFPTYTLGNIYAAQLFASARAALTHLDDDFAQGNFAGLLEWLRDHVYRHGSRYPASAMIEHATGMPPDHRPLVNALKAKYGEMYGL
jgi:carboxypeptidase Taq